MASPNLPSPSQNDGPLDPAGVAQLRADLGSTEVFSELVELFGSQTPDHLIQLRDAISAGDATAVSSHAHRLKGGCLALAANRMAKFCEVLEQSARAGSLENAKALADQIQLAFDQAYAALRREVT